MTMYISFSSVRFLPYVLANQGIFLVTLACWGAFKREATLSPLELKRGRRKGQKGLYHLTLYSSFRLVEGVNEQKSGFLGYFWTRKKGYISLTFTTYILLLESYANKSYLFVNGRGYIRRFMTHYDQSCCQRKGVVDSKVTFTETNAIMIRYKNAYFETGIF